MKNRCVRLGKLLGPAVIVAFSVAPQAKAETLELMCDFDTVVSAVGPDRPNGDHDAFYVSVDLDKASAAFHWGDRSGLGPVPATVSQASIAWTVPAGGDGFGEIVKIDRMSGRITLATTVRNEAGHGGFSGKCRPAARKF